MADGVNNMVQGHITVKKKAMACVAESAKETSKLLWKNSRVKRSL